ncbi:MAG TPA: hypothetical protein VF198_10650 [Vicinamibacterales bacterium]
MGWQELAVVLIVVGAVAFLVSRFVTPRRARKGSQTFVPLASVRKRPPSDGGCCH